jgi:NAD(P)-dependent dehydrogenase (short-subunit alcohol dehydrogenase family)
MRKERSLSGMTAVVTGATAGIGLETVECLARQGVWIFAVGRDPVRCREAERLVRLITPNARLRYLVADLSLQSEVRRLAAEIVRALDDAGHPGLDLLLHVAGTFSTGRKSSEGIEVTLAVNHLAPLLLSYQLLPRLQQVRGRIITVNSASHRRTWLRPEYLNQDCLLHGLWAYKVSKMANLLTSAEFNRRFGSTSVRMLCLDPGLVNTDIGCKRTSFLERFVWNRRKRHGVSPEVPARSLLQLAAVDILPPPEALYWYGDRPIAPSDKVHNHSLAISVWRESCSLCGITSKTKELATWNSPLVPRIESF